MFRMVVSAKVRLLAFFVLTFLCLNVGGALCVAYCQEFDMWASAEHCPLEKSAHCDKPDGDAAEALAVTGHGQTPDCCPFTVSFLGAPVEKPQVSVDQPVVLPVERIVLSHTAWTGRQLSQPTPVHRGPPLDHRFDRIKNCTFRI
jgi:hypothetical protein